MEFVNNYLTNFVTDFHCWFLIEKQKLPARHSRGIDDDDTRLQKGGKF